jgi:putative sigma-54 modulation protein
VIKLHITSKDFDMDDSIRAYIERKIGRLDKYFPKNFKDLEGRVILEVDPSGREDNKFACEVMLETPGPNLEARDATLNMYAAVDIVEAKLKTQIAKFKDKHSSDRLRRSKEVIRRILNRQPEE